MKKLSKITAVFLAAAVCAAFPQPVYADDRENITEEVFEEDVEEELDPIKYDPHFIEKDGKIYYVGENGKYLTGKVKITDKYNFPRYYYFRSDGSMFTGFLRAKNGKVYYYNEDRSGIYYGQLFTGGEITVNGKEYLFNYDYSGENCYRLTGAFANLYYKKSGGKIKSRKAKINGTVYIFDENGRSVPFALAEAEPKEFSFVQAGGNADELASLCGAGKVSSDDDHVSFGFGGSYKGKVLIDGEDADIRIHFDKDKITDYIEIRVQDDHREKYVKLFDTLYGKKNKHALSPNSYYTSDITDDNTKGYFGYISFINGITEISYGYEEPDEIDE